MSVLEKLLSEFVAIDTYMKAVREILQAGHMPDMAGLDARVTELCSEIEAADQQTQQQCLPKLNELLQRLDICETEIRAWHDGLGKAASE